MKQKSLNIIISTVKRPNNSPYLDRLITSIRKEYRGRIILMVGGDDFGYTSKYEKYKGFEKYYVGFQENKYSNNIQKAGYGYYRCLTLDPTHPCLILEDDGVLVEGWYSKLQNLLKFIKDDKFVLSLLSPSKESVTNPDIDVPSVQKFVYRSFLTYGKMGELPASTVVTYSNTTGIYYPASLLQTRLPEFIYNYAVEGQAVYDIVLGQYMFRYNLPIYIAVPNLLKFEVDSTDSSLGSVKKMSHIDYSQWDFTRL